MESIKLIKPAPQYKQAIIEYRDEFMNAGETIHGSGGLDRISSIEEWFQHCVDSENIDTLSEDRVPATQFLAVRESDDRLVGMIQIRHTLNAHLKLEGGHIGYSVRKSERRKGYATQMLRLALVACKGFGIKEALITCEPNNIGSAGVIKANGGVYERQVKLENGEMLDHYLIAVQS